MVVQDETYDLHSFISIMLFEVMKHLSCAANVRGCLLQFAKKGVLR